MLALVVMTRTCSVNMNAQFYNDKLENLWPEFDDDTIEAAAKALPAKLIGT